jgi:hypothetical protein
VVRRALHADRREPAAADERAPELALHAPTARRILGLQRLAGNRAVAAALGHRPLVQRDEPAMAPAGVGSREPNSYELADWSGVVSSQPFRIVRAAEDGYNCFAWALGSTSQLITNETLEKAGYEPNLAGWTGYVAELHGFGRHADGLDASADLILYGDSPTTMTIWHAARKADEPFGSLTFSSKIGGGYGKTPVILHAPADVQSNLYGIALRSFWRGPADAAETPSQEPRFRLFPGLFRGRD